MTTDDRPRRATATPSGAPRRSGHAAAGGRILAAGVSASVAVGLVAIMARPRPDDVVLTVTQPQAAVAPPDTTPMTTAPPQVVVVIVEDTPAPAAASPTARTPAPAPARPVPPPTVTVPAPPATPAPRPAVTPTTARPDTKTRAS